MRPLILYKKRFCSCATGFCNVNCETNEIVVELLVKSNKELFAFVDKLTRANQSDLNVLANFESQRIEETYSNEC